MLAAESIYILPYVLARVFRPTFLDVFNLTNLELGGLFSIYGIVAFFSYLYGGVLADRYSPRKLLSISLIFTSLGGLIMMTYPSYFIMQLLFAYWGFTTVFIFWAPMLKATRAIGGVKMQGKTFSFLDGGRGIVASSIGLIGVLIFSILITKDVSSLTLSEKQEVFKYVIGASSLIVFIIGIVVYTHLKIELKDDEKIGNIKSLLKLAKLKSVWLISFIILCAYMGYKITDVYSLYASEVMLFDEINAARVGALQQYLRPIVCISVAFFTDKNGNINNILIGFFVMMLGSILFASGLIGVSMNMLFFISLIIVATGTYAIRGLYFSVLKNGKIPYILSGTAIGLISMVGYSPDIFATPLYGYLLDNYPGIKGHQYVYLILFISSIVGIYVSLKFKKLNNL
ncbi:MAG: MFS transporter [Candidatus Marisimplicoccus sp.]